MADKLIPYASSVKGLVQNIFWPSIDRIEKVTAPILFVRGMRDELVPPE